MDQREARLREYAVLLSRQIDRIKQNECGDSPVKEAFRSFADTIPCVVWTARSDGEVTFKSRRYYELFGCAEWVDLLHPDDREATLDAWFVAVTKGTPYSHVCRMRRRDGSYATLVTNAHPVANKEGGVDYWIGSSNEVQAVSLIREVA